MSKLDDILDAYWDEIKAGEELVTTIQARNKKQIKDLVLELIDDLENHYAYYLNQTVGKKRAKFADELHQKVNDL